MLVVDGACSAHCWKGKQQHMAGVQEKMFKTFPNDGANEEHYLHSVYYVSFFWIVWDWRYFWFGEQNPVGSYVLKGLITPNSPTQALPGLFIKACTLFSVLSKKGNKNVPQHVAPWRRNMWTRSWSKDSTEIGPALRNMKHVFVLVHLKWIYEMPCPSVRSGLQLVITQLKTTLEAAGSVCLVNRGPQMRPWHGHHEANISPSSDSAYLDFRVLLLGFAVCHEKGEPKQKHTDSHICTNIHISI
jgi:hypothetical protein